MSLLAWEFTSGPWAGRLVFMLRSRYVEIALPDQGRYVWNEAREDYDWIADAHAAALRQADGPQGQ